MQHPKKRIDVTDMLKARYTSDVLTHKPKPGFYSKLHIVSQEIYKHELTRFCFYKPQKGRPDYY